MTINWPAIISRSGDVELLYVRDAAHLDEVLSDETGFDAADCLVDTAGDVFSPVTSRHRVIGFRATGRQLPLDAVLGLVKGHAAQAGSCCVAKLYAPTIRAAIELAGTVADE